MTTARVDTRYLPGHSAAGVGACVSGDGCPVEVGDGHSDLVGVSQLGVRSPKFTFQHADIAIAKHSVEAVRWDTTETVGNSVGSVRNRHDCGFDSD